MSGMHASVSQSSSPSRCPHPSGALAEPRFPRHSRRPSLHNRSDNTETQLQTGPLKTTNQKHSPFENDQPTQTRNTARHFTASPSPRHTKAARLSTASPSPRHTKAQRRMAADAAGPSTACRVDSNGRLGPKTWIQDSHSQIDPSCLHR